MESTDLPSTDEVDAGFISLDSWFDFEEKSKFETHGGKIREMLGQELQLIKLGTKARLYEYQIEAVMSVAKHFSERREINTEVPAAMIVAPPGT